MAILAQNTYSIKRLIQEGYTTHLDRETISIPCNSDGTVISYADAKVNAKLKWEGKEIFPTYNDELDEVLVPKNLLLKSGEEVTNNKYLLNSYTPSEWLVQDEVYTALYDVKLKDNVTGIRTNLSKGYSLQSFHIPSPIVGVRSVQIATGIASYAGGRTPEDYPLNGILELYIRPNEQNTGGADSTIYKIKVEKGSNPNPIYTPAPKDSVYIKSTTNCTATLNTTTGEIAVTALTADIGYIDVMFEYEREIAVRRITVAKVKDGRGVSSIEIQYHISDSKTQSPLEYSNGWTATKPPFEFGKYLWTRTKITYTDGSYEIKGKGVSGEWEAINDMEIGGANISNFSNITFGDVSNQYKNKVIAGGYTHGKALSNGQDYILMISSSNCIVGGATHYNVLFYDLVNNSSYASSYTYTAKFGAIPVILRLKSPPTGYPSLLIYAGIAGATAGKEVEFREVMLQKGNKPTAYTPSMGYLLEGLANETDITGGIVATNLLMMKDSQNEIRAGMSGLDDNVAFWGGGTYEDALNDLANVIIRKDGSNKFGILNLDREGVMYTESGGIRRFSINNALLPELSDLTSGRVITDSVPINNINTSSVQSTISPNTVTVSQNNSKLTLNASFYNFQIGIYPESSNYYGLLVVKCIVIDSNNKEIGVIYDNEVYVDRNSSEYNSNNDYGAIDRSLYNIGVGTYRLKLLIERTGDSTNTPIFVAISGIVFSSYFKFDLQQIAIGQNGMLAFYTPFKYFYLNTNEKTGQSFLNIKGTTDMPGVLLAGDGASGGGGTIYFGAKKHATNTVEKITGTTGKYRIWHSIGHSSYTVQLTMKTAGRNGIWLNPQNNYVDVEIYNGTTLANGNFSFVIYGDN